MLQGWTRMSVSDMTHTVCLISCYNYYHKKRELTEGQDSPVRNGTWTRQWRSGIENRWRRKIGGGEAFQAVGLPRAKAGKPERTYSLQRMMRRWIGPTMGQRGRKDKIRSLNLRYHRRVLWKDLEYMQVLYITVVSVCRNRSTDIHKYLSYHSHFLLTGQGSYQILMLPSCWTPCNSSKEI